MKIRFLKLRNWLLASLMGSLGLSACHSSKNVVSGEKDSSPRDKAGIEEQRMMPMYGVQTGDFSQNVRRDSSAAVRTPEPREPQVTVYGVPTVDFTVKGRVVDEKGKPVRGLQVTLINSEVDAENIPDTPYWNNEIRRHSDTTDADGSFVVRTSDRPWEKVQLMVKDIDGTKNGNFENQSLNVEFEESGNKPVSDWNLGERVANVEVKLKKKK